MCVFGGGRTMVVRKKKGQWTEYLSEVRVAGGRALDERKGQPKSGTAWHFGGDTVIGLNNCLQRYRTQP